ncbi:hypothetical protein J7K27_03985 [Candidatus Bathyarchaeota archaeon]|nr:hypothetical protein [Candidatus Bathyarchaeota archaeon]
MKFKVIIPIILVVFCICLITIFVFFRGNSESPRAIILDNLGLDGQSPSGEDIQFVQETRKLLEDIGVKVDYVGVNDVTLEVYQDLAKYNLVILRVHSGLLVEEEEKEEVVCFFTSEPFPENSDEYSEWFNKNYLAKATFERSGESFIGVKPDFISNCLNGEFHNSIIIAMGCNSSINDSMARAFVNDRKAFVYIGWTRDVTVNHTDSATLGLLESLFENNETIKEAINKAPADPKTGAKLTYYPYDTGNFDMGNLRPKEIIEQLLEKKSSFIPDLIDVFSWVLLITLSASNWFDSCYRRFFRKF